MAEKELRSIQFPGLEDRYVVPEGGGGATGPAGKDGLTPTIGANGNWYLGDEDTGKPSRGEKGDPGAKGADGAAGKDGSDGYSPEATVTPINGGAKIIIKDRNGTTSANVMNGAQGPKGDAGPQGPKGDSGATDLSLGITGAQIGQIAKITAVDTDGKPTAWTPVDMPIGGGLPDEQISALDGLFAIAAYTSDPSDAYKAFRLAFGLPVTAMYRITNNLTNVSTNNSVASVASGARYSATITVEDGYTLGAVTVTMGGVDITDTAYADGVITITQVIGDVVITATAVAPASGNGWTADVPYDITWADGYSIAIKSGEAVEDSAMSLSSFLPCKDLRHYVQTGGYMNFGAAFYDEKNIFLRMENTGVNQIRDGDIACCSFDAAYFRVQKRLVSAATITPKVLPVLDPGVTPEAGVKYSVNMKFGKTVWNATGTEMDNANEKCTDFLLCYGFAKVTVPFKTRAAMVFYDADKAYLSTGYFTSSVNAMDIPRNAAYCRYSIDKNITAWPYISFEGASA